MRRLASTFPGTGADDHDVLHGRRGFDDRSVALGPTAASMPTPGMRRLGDGDFLASGQTDRNAAPDFSSLIHIEGDLARPAGGDCLL